jgi:hypothetical protein
MNLEQWFSLALGLVPPWLVDDVTFQVEDKRLDLHINFPKGSRFAWMENAKASGLSSMVKVAYTIMNHWEGILRWFDSHISNGILEGFNSLLQSAKSKARGYRTHRNFINMAYLVLGRLHFQLPT